MSNFDLIFDNAGGVVLQNNPLPHEQKSAIFYNGNEMKHLVDDVASILNINNKFWEWSDEGCDPVVYDYEEERRGAYSWVTDNDVLEALALDEGLFDNFLSELSSVSMYEFFQALYTQSTEQSQ